MVCDSTVDCEPVSEVSLSDVWSSPGVGASVAVGVGVTMMKPSLASSGSGSGAGSSRVRSPARVQGLARARAQVLEWVPELVLVWVRG